MVSAKPNPEPEFLSRYQEVMEALSKPVCSYTLLHEPHLIPETKSRVGVQKDNTAPRTPKSRPGYTNKNKSEKKANAKKIAHGFLTNVKTLTMTGLLDGVVVKYVSKTKKFELCGVIKGPGYLCGCQSCNYSETVNAYEFENHAGCKTSHPNNHIHFENGNSMHKVVQELKSTPGSMLLDAIHTLTGCPINQEIFSAWKESCQAA